MSKNQLRNTLLSFGLCGSLLAACTGGNGNHQENAENLKAESTRKIDKANKLQSELNQLIDENKQIQSDLKQSKIEIAQLKHQTEQTRSAVEEEAKAFALDSSQRQARILQLDGQIQANNTRLIAIQKKIESAERDLEQINSEVSIESTRLADIKSLAASEKAAADAEMAQQKVLLASLKAGAVTDIEALHADAANSIEASKKEAAIAAHKMLERVNNEIEKRRDNYSSEEEARKVVMAEEEQKIKDRMAEVEAQQAAVQERESEVTDRETSVAEQLNSLEKLKKALASERAQLEANQKEFADRVEAAREFFVSKDLADVWANIEAGSNYSFRVVLLGNGSVDQIQNARKKVTDFNNKNGLKSDNEHQDIYPDLALSKDRLTNLTSLLSNTDLYIYEKSTDQTIVNDSYIITGKAEDVFSFVKNMNGDFSQVSNNLEKGAATMLIKAYPITQVKVSMAIDIYGSSRMDHHRKITKFASFSVDPMVQELHQLEDIDLSNPSQYVLKNLATPVDCDNVDLECLKSLKSSGLLSKKARFTFTNAEGERVKNQEMTQADALEALIEASIQKLFLQNLIKQMENQGVSVNIQVRPTTAWEWFWSGDDYRIDENADTSEITRLFNNRAEQREKLEILASQKIIEKIEISYKVTSVETIEGVEDSLSLMFAEASIQDDELIISSKVRDAGEVEMSLPITSTKGATSQFEDLSLKGFTAGLVLPKEPAKVKADELSGAELRTHNQRMEDYRNAMEETKKELASRKDVEYQSRSTRLMGRMQHMLEILKNTK